MAAPHPPAPSPAGAVLSEVEGRRGAYSASHCDEWFWELDTLHKGLYCSI